MSSYFISNGTEIINFILADTKEIAEMVSGGTAIQFEDAPQGMSIGWVLEGDTWINPNPPAIIETTLPSEEQS